MSVFSPAFIYATTPTVIDQTCPGKRADDHFYDELKKWSINVALYGLGLQNETGGKAGETEMSNKDIYTKIAGD